MVIELALHLLSELLVDNLVALVQEGQYDELKASEDVLLLELQGILDVEYLILVEGYRVKIFLVDELAFPNFAKLRQNQGTK